MVILLACMGKYLILSLKKYFADRIIEAQTKQFIVTIKPNRKSSSVTTSSMELIAHIQVEADANDSETSQ